MSLPRVIPCLLLKGRGLFKTVQFQKPKYVGDPMNAVRIFNEKEVDELLLLDIDASRENRPPQFDLIQEIASECFMPLCYGGGVTTVQQVEKLFKAGVEKVAINSASFDHPHLIQEATKAFGSQSIVASVDIKKSLFGKSELFSHSGQKKRSVDPVRHVQQVQDLGAGEIVINSIDRDGTGQGYDIPLLKRICESTSVPIIACGGAGHLNHFKEAIDVGVSAVAAGSFFVFHGKHRAVLITYPSRLELQNIFNS